METLLYIVLWAGFIWLLNGMGSGLQSSGPSDASAKDGAGKSKAAQVVGTPPERAVDPACGRSVRTDKAKSNVYAGRVNYFCSRECREVFEAAPDLYVGRSDADERGLGRSHA